MKSDPRARGRSRPVLLSALVFPGLGQMVVGRPWRALFFCASSLALLAAVVVRVAREAQRLMPADPEALFDPALPFRLAAEIHRANASFFLWCTVGIVGLWAGSVLDLFLSIPRGAVSPAPRELDQNHHPSGPASARGPEG